MSAIFNILTWCIYLTVISFLFIWLNKKKGNPIATRWLISAFVVKVLAGCVYGYLYAHYFPSSDSWMLFNESLKEYHNLLHAPRLFFSTDVNFNNLGDVFSNADNATWKNFDDNLFIKILGLLNVLSFGNYYIDVVLFNFFSTWGLYCLYKAVAKQYPVNPQWLALVIFLLPSCLFWCSGIHKDGLIVFFTGSFIGITCQLTDTGFSFKNLLLLLAAFLMIFVFRNISALILVPATIAWWLCKKTKYTPIRLFLAVYAFSIIAFFASSLGPAAYNLPLLLAEKQHQFLALEGGSLLPMEPLQPTPRGYLKLLPAAVDHAFFRPRPAEAGSPLYLVAFIEWLSIFSLIGVATYVGRKQLGQLLQKPFTLFLLFIAVSSLLIIGFTVPFTGAIVRYKAFYSVLLLLPFVPLISAESSTSDKHS